VLRQISLLFEIASFEKGKDIFSGPNMDCILEGCKDVIPENNVFARDIVK
jgi:hypothetical protein